MEVLAFDAPRGVDPHFSILRCESCDGAWQYPPVRQVEKSVEVFETAYSTASEGYFDPEKRKAIAGMQKQLIENVARKGSLLDIGCGDGTLAKMMYSAGWRVVGVDPAMPADAELRSEDGGLRLGRTSSADLPVDQVFDVVTLFDVVEHLEEPDALIGEAFSRLAPGGLLVVETGNFQSAGRIEAGPSWWNFQFDHRWYFAPPQLSNLLVSAGFADLRVHSSVLRPWWRGQAMAGKPSLRPLLRSVAKGLPAIRLEIDRYRDHGQARIRWPDWSGLEIMTLLAKRPN